MEIKNHGGLAFTIDFGGERKPIYLSKKLFNELASKINEAMDDKPHINISKAEQGWVIPQSQPTPPEGVEIRYRQSHLFDGEYMPNWMEMDEAGQFDFSKMNTIYARSGVGKSNFKWNEHAPPPSVKFIIERDIVVVVENHLEILKEEGFNVDQWGMLEGEKFIIRSVNNEEKTFRIQPYNATLFIPLANLPKRAFRLYARTHPKVPKLKRGVRVLVPKDRLSYIKEAGTVVTNHKNTYYYLPYWYKDNGGNYEELPLDNLPKELIDMIKDRKVPDQKECVHCDEKWSVADHPPIITETHNCPNPECLQFVSSKQIN